MQKIKLYFFLLLLFIFHLQNLSFAQVRRGSKKADRQKYATVALDGSGKYTSIQQAIDQAEFNATIKIKAGVYNEKILLKNFVNLDGDGIGKTIIQTDGSTSVIEAYNLGGGKIANMSVTFSKPANRPLLYSKYSTFFIENCSFMNGGNGIEILSSSSVNIRQSSFRGNIRNGIVVMEKSHGYIIDCVISENQSDGIFIGTNASPTIEKNIIKENGGNGITVTTNSTNKVLGNYIYQNKKNGIMIDNNASPLVRNNTIVKNGTGVADKSAADNFVSGYGILIRNTSAISLINNICALNVFGIGVKESKSIELLKNNLWNNDSNYIGVFAHSTDMNVDPFFLNPDEQNFKIATSSQLYRKGEDDVSIGAHYDNTRIEKKRRLDYLKTQATKDLARENWYLAYQSAQEILSIDKSDTEGKTLFKKAGSEMARNYLQSAKMDYDAGNFRVADNYLTAALKYDPDNSEILELKALIDDEAQLSQLKTLFMFSFGLIGVFVFGLWWKKRIQTGEIKRQVLWWLNDSEEQVELARASDAEKYANEYFTDAVVKLNEAKQAFATNQFDSCEALCNEAARHAVRARDEAEKFKQIRKDAHLALSNAEVEMQRQAHSEIAERFEDEIKEFSFYLERAQDALIHKQFVLAKEIAEDIQSSLKKLHEQLQAEKDDKVLCLIDETEKLIIEALTSNTSADIIIAVIDFKAELEILKNGFNNGQIQIEEITHQILQIKEFVSEALRLGDEFDPVSRPKRKKNYYEILGVKEDATLEQIKSVYRKLSMIYHPDMNTSGELGIAGDERFREIKEAYEILIAGKPNQ
ncbi:DnaJ domain-containing protein [bacterium]|nr:MAG: DnaJ domain-containing protein [bacterium]